MKIKRFGYCRRRGFLTQKFNQRTKVESCSDAQSKPFSPAFGNTVLSLRCSFSSTGFSVILVFCMYVIVNFRNVKRMNLY